MVPSMYCTVILSTACDSACDEGLMRCFGNGAGDCCNYYSSGMCVADCPSPFIPNSDSICACPEGQTGNNCEIGEHCSLYISDNHFHFCHRCDLSSAYLSSERSN